ncbi:MAG: acyl-CoA desaturase [Planctomycetes bacterium]|nr:acyl-CoA desaturase [Planctomycetota bacterium]
MHSPAELQACVHYAKEIRPDLPAEVFARNPLRLLWLPVHLAVIGCSIAAIVGTGIPIYAKLALSVVIGHSYGVLMYLAHEILHGSVIKNSFWQNWISGLCMLPYCIGPAHWKAWHNRAHHGHTTQSGVDPDSFGNVTMFMCNRVARFMLKFAPGSGKLRSGLFLGFWFSFHAVVTLLIHSQRYNYWTPERRRRQIALFALEVGFWGCVAYNLGLANFAMIYLVPMVFANVLQMSYIATNHLLCDETADVNDPLANSLSVTVPTWMDWLHLNFSYHIEHHIYPYVNSYHAPKIRDALVHRYGNRYRHLPILQALRLLYKTPSAHLSQSELVDIETGAVFSTLGPEGELPHSLGSVPVPVRPRRPQAENQAEPSATLRLAEGTSSADETVRSEPNPIRLPVSSARPARQRAA